MQIKKTGLILFFLVLFSTISFASPLEDYSQGKWAVDINWRPNLKMNNRYDGYYQGSYVYSANRSLDGKNGNFDWDVTIGLGNKLAFQFGQYNPKAAFGVGMNTWEANLLYKLGKNISLFAGYHNAHYSGEQSFQTNGILQGGLIAYRNITNKTTLYGVVGFGKDLLNWEAGISYHISKNVDFNLSYRYKNVKKLYDASGDFSFHDDVIAKGIGYGVTLKF